jgi:hypothetical protein
VGQEVRERRDSDGKTDVRKPFGRVPVSSDTAGSYPAGALISWYIPPKRATRGTREMGATMIRTTLDGNIHRQVGSILL